MKPTEFIYPQNPEETITPRTGMTILATHSKVQLSCLHIWPLLSQPHNWTKWSSAKTKAELGRVGDEVISFYLLWKGWFSQVSVD